MGRLAAQQMKTLNGDYLLYIPGKNISVNILQRKKKTKAHKFATKRLFVPINETRRRKATPFQTTHEHQHQQHQLSCVLRIAGLIISVMAVQRWRCKPVIHQRGTYRQTTIRPRVYAAFTWAPADSRKQVAHPRQTGQENEKQKKNKKLRCCDGKAFEFELNAVYGTCYFVTLFLTW